jgi:hypothetical protein
MAQHTPATHTRRPALRDPEWWTSVAAALLAVKFGSLAKDIAQLLKKDQKDTPYGLSFLYQDLFGRAAQGMLDDKYCLRKTLNSKAFCMRFPH